MAHPQHNFTSNFNGSDGHNAELTLNINGVEKKYTPAGNDQTYNVPGVARIDINLDGADLVQAIQTALDGAAQPVLVEASIYDEEYVYQYIGELDGQWYFGTCTTEKIVTITVAKEDGALNGEQIPVANGVVIVESDGLNVYSRLRTALALGQLPVLSYVGANPVYAQYEKTADNGDLIFVGALASASDTYVQYNIYTVASNNTVTVTTRAASAGGGGTPDDENGFFNSSLYQTPGDGVTDHLTLDDFRIKQGTSIHGSNIEFVVTHTEGGIDFGEVWLNPGTYILNIRYTLQWVGNPRGTFKPLVCRVGTQPFDFSFEQENTLITSQIRVVTARQKVSIAFPFDADTPTMGIWVETLSIAQLASNTHPAVVHDTTLAGSGTAGSPLGVTTDAFGKIKDIPTSISQFRNGDVIPVDGPNGPAKMLASELQDAILGRPVDEAVQAWLDEHPEATTTVQDHSLTYKKLVNGTLNFVTPEMFGAVGDGVTDDTVAIQAAMDACSVVVFGDKTYIIDVSGGGWGTIARGGLKCNSGQVLFLGNCTLKAKPNTNSSGFYDIISVDLANNVKIIGGHIVGDLDNHEGSDGEFGFGITISKANCVTITGVEIEKCWGDGIITTVERVASEGSGNYDDYCQNICIKNCHIHNCRRQGISVVNANGLVISDCYIHDIAGAEPQSCIDVEPDRSDAKNIVICNCCLVGNKGLLLGSTHDMFLLHNVSVRDCITNISAATRLYETQVDSCICDSVITRVYSNLRFSKCVINVLDVRSSAKAVFDACTINNGISITLDQYVAGTSFVARNCLIRAKSQIENLIYTNVYGFEKFEFHDCDFDMSSNVNYFINGGVVGSTVLIKGGTLRIGGESSTNYVFHARPNNTTGGYSVSYIIDGLAIYVTTANRNSYLFLTDMSPTVLNCIVKNCIIEGVNRLAFIYGLTGAVFVVANSIIKNSTYGLDQIIEQGGASGTAKYYSSNVNLDLPPT